MLLKDFGCQVSGNKPVLQNRAFGLLRLQGASKLNPVIQNVIAKSRSHGRIITSSHLVRSRDVNVTARPIPQESQKKSLESHSCPVRFKEATFHKVLESLVPPTILGEQVYVDGMYIM